MSLRDLLPSGEQWEALKGVEGGLLRRKRVGAGAGVVAIASAALQVVLVLAEEGYAQKLGDLVRYVFSLQFHKLGEAGLVNYEKWSGVTLTEEGQTMADELQEKHDTLKEFLTILGVPTDVADSDACVMEHNISPETLDRLTSFVRFVSLPEDGPIWLLHFREFYETGTPPACARECMRSCAEESQRLMDRLRGKPPGEG